MKIIRYCVTCLFVAIACQKTTGKPSITVDTPSEPAPPREIAKKSSTRAPENEQDHQGNVETTTSAGALGEADANPSSSTNEAVPVSDEGAAAPVHIWKKGDKMACIVGKRYGLAPKKDWTDTFRLDAISDLVRKYNGLENRKRIPEGYELILPEREQIFIDAGFPADLRTSLKALFKVEALYHEHAEAALDDMCENDQPISEALRGHFDYMAQKTRALKARLESIKRSGKVSKALKKVLRTLGYLDKTFEFVLQYKKRDEEYCDFGAKDVTGTKRLFSNLSYQLYSWSVSR